MIRFKFFEMHWITHRQNSRISLGRKQHYAACMPVKLFSRSVSPPDSKILFPSTEQTTSLPASLALSENEKPPKQKLFCDCGQHPHDTGLLFKFSGHFEVCKLVYLSANFLPVQLVRPLGSDWRSQRSIQTTPIRARIVLTTP